MESQPAKANDPIDFKKGGNSISDNEVQNQKEHSSISITFDENFTFCKLLHSKNASFPIMFIDDGIAICLSSLHWAKNTPSSELLNSGIDMCFKFKQPSNAFDSIICIEVGIIIFVSDLYSENANEQIVVILELIVISVMFFMIGNLLFQFDI